MKKNFKLQLKENPTLCLDLETGGFDASMDAICSISICLPDGSNNKTWFIKPYNKRYNDKALEINGLTKDYLDVNGVYLEEFAMELIEYCIKNFGKYNLGLIQLLGHNISFDIEFLKECFNNDLEIERQKEHEEDFKIFKYKDIFHYHFKDSMILANMLKDLKLIPIEQSISLSNLYKYLIGEDELYKNAHNSLADVLMSLECYAEMLNLIKKTNFRGIHLIRNGKRSRKNKFRR